MLQVELKGVEKKHNTFFNVRTTWFKSRRIYRGGSIPLAPRESQGGLPPHWDLSAKVKIRCGR